MCGQVNVCPSKRYDAGVCGVNGSDGLGAWVVAAGRRRSRVFAQAVCWCREGPGRVAVVHWPVLSVDVQVAASAAQFRVCRSKTRRRGRQRVAVCGSHAGD